MVAHGIYLELAGILELVKGFQCVTSKGKTVMTSTFILFYYCWIRSAKQCPTCCSCPASAANSSATCYLVTAAAWQPMAHTTLGSSFKCSFHLQAALKKKINPLVWTRNERQSMCLYVCLYACVVYASMSSHVGVSIHLCTGRNQKLMFIILSITPSPLLSPWAWCTLTAWPSDLPPQCWA